MEQVIRDVEFRVVTQCSHGVFGRCRDSQLGLDFLLYNSYGPRDDTVHKNQQEMLGSSPVLLSASNHKRVLSVWNLFINSNGKTVKARAIAMEAAAVPC